MSQAAGTGAARDGGGDGGPPRKIDWLAAEKSPEFRELIAKRRSFVLPATIFFLAWYTIFVLLAGYAEGFMGTKLVGGLTVGYTLALTQFVMVWVLSVMYLRKADREFEPLEQRAAARAVEGFAVPDDDDGRHDGSASSSAAKPTAGSER